MELIIPELPNKKKGQPAIAGVYRIDFDAGYFYIGSSVKLRTRFVAWKRMLLSGKTKNRNIDSILSLCSKATFKILEFVADLEQVRDIETAYLRQSYTCEGFLNRVLDAKTGKEWLPYFGQPIKVPLPKYERPKVTIACFDMECHLLQIYPSITATAKALGIQDRKINDLCKGIKQSYHGYRFRYLQANGEPEPFVRKVRKNPAYSKRDEKYSRKGKLTELCKPIKIEKDSVCKVFPSQRDAARWLNVPVPMISRISRSPTRRYKGWDIERISIEEYEKLKDSFVTHST